MHAVGSVASGSAAAYMPALCFSPPPASSRADAAAEQRAASATSSGQPLAMPLGAAVCLGVDGKLSAVRQMDQDVAGVLEGPHFVFQTEARCGLGDRQLELSGGRDVVHDAAG